MNALRCGGIVLCGGASSRMGTAKAWLPFGDETLLQRVVRIVGEVVAPVVVVAAPGQGLPPLSSDVLVAYDAQPGRGPLEGVRAGLEALHGLVDVAFVTTCDAPLLRSALMHRMVQLLGEYEAAAPRIDGRWYPLTAVYRLAVLARVERMLDTNQLRMSDLLVACSAREVTPHELAAVDPELDSLRSCNTPEEYEQAIADAARRGISLL